MAAAPLPVAHSNFIFAYIVIGPESVAIVAETLLHSQEPSIRGKDSLIKETEKKR